MNLEAKQRGSLTSLALWLVSLAVSVAPFRAAADAGTTTAWDWGFNGYGQLGNGSSTDSDVPVSTIPEPSSVARIAGGAWHSLALTKQGNSSSTIWAWGDNVYGQLGTTTAYFTYSDVPVQVLDSWSPIGEALEIAAGGGHSLALVKGDGPNTVWAWGDDSFGQLGINSNYNVPVPVPVQDVGGIFPSSAATTTAIAAGEWHSLALTQNGSSTVWAWGNNAHGQLGDGTNAESWFAVPLSTSTPSGFADEKLIAIAAGDRHSLALSQSGQVWAWGWNAYGQLGNGTIIDSNVPVRVSTSTALGIGDDKVIAIAAGAFHSLALGESGNVYAWGGNGYGQLGNGGGLSSDVPVGVSTSTGIGDDKVVAIAAGGIHSLAATNSGSSTVWAWGENSFGELGDGTTTRSSSPVPVSGPAGLHASAIAGGWLHSLAIFEEAPPCVTETGTVLSATSTAVGVPVTDTAYVVNSASCPYGNPGGTVTFLYQAPGTTTWANWETDGLSGSPSSATSTPFTPAVAGTYHFKAVYGGDLNHSGSTSSDEELTVGPSLLATTVTTLLSNNVIRLHGTLTDTVTISSTVSGPAEGSWTVEASRSSDFSSPVLLAGPSPVSSLPLTVAPSFTLPSSGVWYLRAAYTGDSNYQGSHSGSLDEILFVLPY